MTGLHPGVRIRRYLTPARVDSYDEGIVWAVDESKWGSVVRFTVDRVVWKGLDDTERAVSTGGQLGTAITGFDRVEVVLPV